MTDLLKDLVRKKEKKEALEKQINELLKPIKKAGVELTKEQLFNEISERLKQVRFSAQWKITLRKERLFDNRWAGDFLNYETFGGSYAQISIIKESEVRILVGATKIDIGW
jgi:hypothetical protein